jgi:hypothetical protein
VIFLLGIVSLAWSAFAMPWQQEAARAVLDGIVMDAATGIPVPGVQISFGGIGGPLRSATTNESGRFRFDSVQTFGLSRLRAGHAQYATESITVSWRGEGLSGEPRRVIRLSDAGDVPAAFPVGPGESVSLEIRMTMSAVLSGRILDERSQPIAEARVDLLVRRYRSDGRPILESPLGFESVLTNEAGDYRYDRVPPGRYYLRASLTVKEPPPSSDSPMASTLIEDPMTATYYPGFRDLARAVPLELLPMGNVLVNITIADDEVYSVRGRIVNPAFFGEPSAYGFFLVPRTSSGMTLADWQVPNYAQDAEGDTFELRNVPLGEFDLYVRYQPRTTDRRRWQPFLGQTVVSVGDEGVEDLVVAIEPHFEVTGQFVFRDVPSGGMTESPTGWPNVLPDLILDDNRPADFSLNGWIQMMSSRGGVTRDGTFVLTGVTRGRYRAVVMSHTIPEGFYVDSIRLGTGNVHGLTFDIVASPAGPLVYELRGNGGRVEGVVVDDNGAMVGLANVVLVPEPARRGDPGAYRSARTDASGRFEISAGVRPGAYTAFAFRSTPGYAVMDPAFIAPLLPEGAAFEVGPEESVGLELELSAER